ncbi:MAG: hypothetical protein HC831_01165 [Chloroflexia bacterium]|nr:hypothetical protein [Chloroflexia bacterium]
MKNSIYGIIILFVLGFVSCKNQSSKNDSNDINKIEIREGTFYGTGLNSSNAVVLADTIAYDVTIKNPDPEDNWTEEDLKGMDELALANIVLNAIYNGRLTAYDFQTEEPMTIEQVKELEAEYTRDNVGRMRFIEEWYFDEKNLQFGKRVNAIMLAYERLNNEGEARYIPGVMVYLNDKSKNPPQKNIE